MFIILSLIVIVAAFNIISGLTILIKIKQKNFILKTLGLSNQSIKKLFFNWSYDRFCNNKRDHFRHFIFFKY